MTVIAMLLQKRLQLVMPVIGPRDGHTGGEAKKESCIWCRLIRRAILLVLLIGESSVGLPKAVHAQGVLENPQPASAQSGIGVISGFVCIVKIHVLTHAKGENCLHLCVFAGVLGGARRVTTLRCGQLQLSSDFVAALRTHSLAPTAVCLGPC